MVILRIFFGISSPIEVSIDCSLFVDLFLFLALHLQLPSYTSVQLVVVQLLFLVEVAYLV